MSEFKDDIKVAVFRAVGVSITFLSLLAVLLILITSCGVKVKHGGESHHYIHVDAETKSTIDINGDIKIVVELKIDQVIQLCKQSDQPELCITDSINQLTSSLEGLQEALDDVNSPKGKKSYLSGGCSDDFCREAE